REGRVDDFHAIASRLTISVPLRSSRQFADGIERIDGSGGRGRAVFSRSGRGHAGSWEERAHNGHSYNYRDLTTICDNTASTPGGRSLSGNFRQSDESV